MNEGELSLNVLFALPGAEDMCLRMRIKKPCVDKNLLLAPFQVHPLKWCLPHKQPCGVENRTPKEHHESESLRK